MPDIEILNLKDFSTLDVLSKLEGLWLNKDGELIYAVASRITWICPMTFDSFPLDVQVNHVFSKSCEYFLNLFCKVCLFQVGSFNYDITKMMFHDEFVAEGSSLKSVLDYWVEIHPLSKQDTVSIVLTGENIRSKVQKFKLLKFLI